MGTFAFSSLGKRCSLDGCELIDFLPFNCDRCNREFCLNHRSYNKHLCPVSNHIDVNVLICPLCAQGVRIPPNEDPNITWDIHVNCECDPSNYQKATKNKCCPVPGCKERLVFSKTIRCKDCSQEHCLRHRFAHDHNCIGPKGSRTGFPFINVLRRSLKNESTMIHTPDSSPKWGLSMVNAASKMLTSAESGMQKLSTAANQALQRAKGGLSLGSCAGGDLVEQCHQCEARFSNVNALIEHVEEVHESNVKPACTIITADVCPYCSRTFGDPVVLVEHVELVHGDYTKFKS